MLNLTEEEVHALDPEIDIVFDKDDDTFFFIFKAGQYKGLAYTYVDVDIIPEKDGIPAEVQFGYAVLEAPTDAMLGTAQLGDQGDHFNNQIGSLLVAMIELIAEKNKAA